MPHRTHEEFERSYDVDSALPVPSFVGVAGVTACTRPEVIELEAVYFDTPALVLARRRVALRHRSGGADAGWHVKRAGAESRHEQQWPSTGRSDTVPDEVLASVAQLLGDAPVAPVASVRNERRVCRLLGSGGLALAEFCDDNVQAVSLADGVETDWREWEIELTATAAEFAPRQREELLDALEAVLVSTGATPSATGSKLARALGQRARGLWQGGSHDATIETDGTGAPPA